MKIKICGISLAEAWRKRKKNTAYMRCFQTLCFCLILLSIIIGECAYYLITEEIVIDKEFWQDTIVVVYDAAVSILMLYILRNFYAKKLFCNGTFRLIEGIALCTVIVQPIIYHIWGRTLINSGMLQCLSLVGICLVTLAEILRLSVRLQEENDLTI